MIELQESDEPSTLRKGKSSSAFVSVNQQHNLFSGHSISSSSHQPTSCLFSGDRFIPFRAVDQTSLHGAERYHHEQNQLLSTHRHAEDSDDTQSLESDNSQNSEDSFKQVKRRQQDRYTKLLQEQCFGQQEFLD